jgi:hypothetical protein
MAARAPTRNSRMLASSIFGFTERERQLYYGLTGS